MLSLHLKAINKTKFEEAKAKEDHKSLRNFVLESFKVVLDFEKKESIETPKDVIKDKFNDITINIKVPSSSGYDIVDKLNLSDLLRWWNWYVTCAYDIIKTKFGFTSF